ncbi:MAG: ZIP family metal transporter [Candidatus Aenigmarchaeota archaeon]|nr:ZIP family metal transporter [Candidatus Aenigmarchaeota archaeon]
MTDPLLLSLISVIAVSLVSFAGVLTLSIKDATLKKVLLYFVGFSAGALLGDVFIHMLPEVAEGAGFGLRTSFFVLSGILASFAMEKIIQWRHCHIPTSRAHAHSFAYMNLFGDAVHNFIDGLIIVASYLVSVPVLSFRHYRSFRRAFRGHNQLLRGKFNAIPRIFRGREFHIHRRLRPDTGAAQEIHREELRAADDSYRPGHCCDVRPPAS